MVFSTGSLRLVYVWKYQMFVFRGICYLSAIGIINKKSADNPVGTFRLLYSRDYSKEAIAFLIISIASRSCSSVMTSGGAKRIICW